MIPGAPHNFSQRLSEAKGIIWDLDNTLYRLDDTIIESFNMAMARAVMAIGLDISFDEAVKLARQSHIETGYSGRIFVQRYGIEPQKLHFDFHGYVDELLIEKNIETQNFFEGLDVKHALITHSARGWALRVLLHLGLNHWFPSERVFALEDYGFQRKAESAEGFVKAIETLSLPPEQLLFVEDTHDNLRIPYELGIGTVFLNHGQASANPPAYIGKIYKNANEFLSDLTAHQGVSRTPPPQCS